MTNEDTQEPDPECARSETPRRRFLLAASGLSMFGLAGCLGADDSSTQVPSSRPSDWCIDDNDVEVPEVYRTAESIDGIARDPEDLTERENAAYQCHPQGYQLCANCRYFIGGRGGYPDP